MKVLVISDNTAISIYGSFFGGGGGGGGGGGTDSSTIVPFSMYIY